MGTRPGSMKKLSISIEQKNRIREHLANASCVNSVVFTNFMKGAK